MNYFTEHAFQSPVYWRIKKNPVYRLLDNKEWLDNFFFNGEILLSCFSKFKKYPNEIQGDSEEGNAMCYFQDENNNLQAIKYEAGMNSYVLSTTEILTPAVINDFKSIGAIKINNTTNFSLEISKRISFCMSGLEGRCNYQDDRIFQLKEHDKLLQYYKSKEGRHSHQFQAELMSLNDEYELFLKKSVYSNQQEYRLIWFSNEIVTESIIVKCPEAIKYCERVDF